MFLTFQDLKLLAHVKSYMFLHKNLYSRIGHEKLNSFNSLVSRIGIIDIWMLDVSQTASYVRQHPNRSCPSVSPSLSFLKIGSLVFYNIVHDDSWA